MKSERAEGARKFFGLYSIKLSSCSSEYRLSLRVSLHSKRNTEKRVHLGQDKGRFLAKKGAPKLSFHREGGQLPPFAPPKSATEYINGALLPVVYGERFQI